MRIIQWEDYRLHLLQSSPYNDSNRLEKYGYKVYSQNDEDGIIAEIFNRIGTTNKVFVEFGVQNGLESNTHLLLLKDWKGLWIEGSESSCQEINALFSEAINGSHQLIVINEFITKDNINEIIQSANITGEIDLLSIDIDGNDWHIFNEISIVNPRVIVIEYNAKLPPDLEWVMPYNPSYMWDGSDYFGASLKAIENLAEKKGYTLVGTNLAGVNAFLVRNDLTRDLFATPATSEYLYNPARYRMAIPSYSGHPSKYFIGKK